MRFRAEQHLRRQGEIRAARETGRKLDCRSYTLWHNSEAAPTAVPRVGVVASRAAVGNAIRRNRAKRRLREIFRKHQSLLPAKSDVLLVARSGAVNRPFGELEKKFVEACGILNASSGSKGGS